MADIKVGIISHFFDKIGVAVVDLSDNLKAGDTIKVVGHGQEFTQTVDSMQVEHETIQTAEKGTAIGMKVTQPVKKGDEVFKITE